MVEEVKNNERVWLEAILARTNDREIVAVVNQRLEQCDGRNAVVEPSRPV